MKMNECLNQSSGDDVVITGMSGRFPNCNNITEFFESLLNKKDLLVETPKEWFGIKDELPLRIGRLKERDQFDSGFFGIHHQQADASDPGGRILLEVAIEAVIDAGLNPSDIVGSRTGVFIAANFQESENFWYYKKLDSPHFGVTGCLRSILAERISHCLQLEGPSVTLDTACCGTGYAVEHGLRAIMSGRCDSAIVGGVNLVLSCDVLGMISRLEVLDVTGENYILDEQVKGYIRSEAVAVILLQKLKDSKRVYAEVVHAQTNSDGFKEESITHLSGKSQTALLKNLYTEANVNPLAINYLEAHSTGTKAGDPEEMEAIALTFCKSRELPILIGSVKSNIGHTESVSALCSLIKVVMGMETNRIPPTINCKNIRRDVPEFHNGKISVVKETLSFEGEKFTAVNNSGFGGTNAHVLLKRFGRKGNRGNCLGKEIVCVSARTQESIEKILSGISSSRDRRYFSLLRNVFRNDIDGFYYRGFVVISQDETFKSYKRCTGVKPSLSLILDGASDVELRRELGDIPVFKEIVERIYTILSTMLVTISQTEVMLLNSVVTQIALIETLRYLELPIECVSGTSSGVIAASYAEGTITVEQGLSLVCQFLPFLTSSSGTNGNRLFRVITKDEETVLLNQLKMILDISPGSESLARHILGNMFESVLRESSNISFNFSGIIHKVIDMQTFLTAIGRLYEVGFCPKIDKFYPTEWPVKASAVSPLITWDHKYSWFVIPPTTKQNMGVKTIDISTTDANYEFRFLLDHGCDGSDGTSLLPTSAYIYFVWKLYAETQKMGMSKCKVVLKDVRLHRAVVIAKDSKIELTVQISKVSKRFEISQSKELLVSGWIQPSVSLHDQPLETINLPKKIINPLKLNSLYKYLALHRYEYRGEFRGIEEIDCKGTQALVKWNGNWITFLDHFLSVSHVKDCTEGQLVITSIDQVSINPFNEPKRSEFVYSDPNCNIIKSPQVEIRGLSYTPIATKTSVERPTLETYKFVPYVGRLTHDEALRAAIRIIVDNIRSAYLRVVEIPSESKERDMGAQISLLLNESLVKNSTTLTNDIKGDTDLVVTTNPSFKIPVVLEKLKEGAFLLLKENVGCSLDVEGSVVVSVQQTDEGVIYLIRKIGSLQSQRVISITSDFEWFSELQTSIAANENILLFAKNEPENGVLGLINSLKVEYQNESISCVYLMDDGPSFSVDEVFYKKQLEKRLLMNVWKNGTWGTYVHFPLNNDTEECDRASGVVEKGNPSSFRWVQAPVIPRELAAAEVYYVGLSYNDVLVTTGRLPSKSKSNEFELGLEFSGINSRCKRVMGITRRGALFNTLPTDQFLTWEIPEHWSLEEAATIPLTYCSALYALVMVAKLKKGQSVLIHAGAGGVGQSAINIALAYNCTVFTTVGSLKKKEALSGYFPNLPDSHIGNSRDSRFQQLIMKKTGGKGVDIVLNSLSIRKLQASALCLSRGGILLEIGRINVAKNQYIDFNCILKSRTFFYVNMDSVFSIQSRVKESLHKYLSEGIQIGYVKPIHSQVFEKGNVEDALSYMTAGTHIGKVVIKLKDEKAQMNRALHASPRFYCNSSKVYVLVGGLGGFGLELADWLVNRGARKLVLVSTRNTLTDYQNFKVEFWRENEVSVVIARQNLLSVEGCEDLINESSRLGEIEAIFNLAVVLNDALFENQTAERFLLSFGPKALITKNLDIVTRKFCTELRYFVVFSSITCGKGHIGQTSYGMANSIMERICEIRKEEGYPAVAIQWGAIADVGLLQNDVVYPQEKVGGTMKQKVAVYLKVLDVLLTQKECILASSVLPNINETDLAPVSNMAEVVKFLGIDLTHVSLHATLSQLGMDSIIGVKIKQFLQDNYGITISIRELRSVTLSQLSESNLGIGQP